MNQTQPSKKLLDKRKAATVVKQAQCHAVSNEVVLEIQEVLLKGHTLEWIKQTILVLNEPSLQAESPHTYVCRYVRDGQVCTLSRRLYVLLASDRDTDG